MILMIKIHTYNNAYITLWHKKFSFSEVEDEKEDFHTIIMEEWFQSAQLKSIKHFLNEHFQVT